MNYMFAWNNPILKNFRRFEALLRHLRYGDILRIVQKFKLLIKGQLKE